MKMNSWQNNGINGGMAKSYQWLKIMAYHQPASYQWHGVMAWLM
jgi:hypothetical protein